MSAEKDRKIGQHTERMAGEYLFREPVKDKNKDGIYEDKPSDTDFFDMRSNINTKQMMKAILYYGGLQTAFNSESAKQKKNFIERLLISYMGIGREQATRVLEQNFPKKVEVEHGSDKMMPSGES